MNDIQIERLVAELEEPPERIRKAIGVLAAPPAGVTVEMIRFDVWLAIRGPRSKPVTVPTWRNLCFAG